MSKAELLEEITRLTPAERSEVWDALWTLEERLLPGVNTPTSEEKAALDAEIESYKSNPTAGKPWTEVESRLRNRT